MKEKPCRKNIQNYFENPGKTNDNFLNKCPKELLEPIKLGQNEKSSKFSHNGVPDVYIDSQGKLFHGAPGDSHCRELILHPLCCFIKSKLCHGDSTMRIKERLQECSELKFCWSSFFE